MHTYVWLKGLSPTPTFNRSRHLWETTRCLLYQNTTTVHNTLEECSGQGCSLDIQVVRVPWCCPMHSSTVGGRHTHRHHDCQLHKVPLLKHPWPQPDILRALRERSTCNVCIEQMQNCLILTSCSHWMQENIESKTVGSTTWSDKR